MFFFQYLLYICSGTTGHMFRIHVTVSCVYYGSKQRFRWFSAPAHGEVDGFKTTMSEWSCKDRTSCVPTKKLDEVFVDFHASDFFVNIDGEKIYWRLKVTVII